MPTCEPALKRGRQLAYVILPIAAIAGVALGLRFRPPAILAASAVLLSLLAVAAIVEGWGVLPTLGMIIAAFINLQGGFFAGAAWPRR